MGYSFLRGRLFAVVVGMTDGILTALTLASGRVFNPGKPITSGLALRIASASSISGVFVFFTAEYMRRRGELVRAERQLSLTARGHLAATQLGKAALRETMLSAVISSGCNFFGTLIPLMAGALMPRNSWMALAVALLFLGVLGAAGGRIVWGNPFLWSVALILAGCILSFTGMKLDHYCPANDDLVAGKSHYCQ